MTKVIKPTSFNPSDAYEARMLAHLSGQGKFATYVKRLIARDMEGWTLTTAPIMSAPSPVAAVVGPAAKFSGVKKAPVVVNDAEAMLDALSF